MRTVITLADAIEDAGYRGRALEWRRSALWFMRELSPRPNEVPRTAKQRRWVAAWTSAVTQQMALLAGCYAVTKTEESHAHAASLYSEFMAYRMPHFGEGSFHTLVSRTNSLACVRRHRRRHPYGCFAGCSRP
jgi:hypothetical protein